MGIGTILLTAVCKISYRILEWIRNHLRYQLNHSRHTTIANKALQWLQKVATGPTHRKSMPRIYLYPPSFTQGKLDPRWVNWAWVPYSRWYREGWTVGGFTGMPTRPQLNESWLRWESNEVLASFCPGNCDGRFYIYQRNNFCYCACHTGYSDTTVTQIGPSLAAKIDFKLAGIRNPGEIGVRIQTLAETLEI